MKPKIILSVDFALNFCYGLGEKGDTMQIMKASDIGKKITLISTPWPLYSRPSIQLGALKSFLNTRIPNLQVDARHFYLQLAALLGYQLYHDISQRTWLSESIYAALLYPQNAEKIEKLYRRERSANSSLQQMGFKPLTRRVQSISDEYIDAINWQENKLVGFSISLCQLTSALYFIKRIRRIAPHVTIVVGGSTLSGNVASAVFDCFPEIDIIVVGEGEIPFESITKQHILDEKPLIDMSSITGAITRHDVPANNKTPLFNQIEDINQCPEPDFDEYFRLLNGLEPSKRFFATLPVEISRGCWWQRTGSSDGDTGCAFCNLNLQWKGYRCKHSSRVASEIDHLTDKYQSLSVAITDNVLPKKQAETIFSGIAELKKDFRLFAEIRADSSFKDLSLMRRSGMSEVQIGIESLSSRLLRKLNKGISAIQNLEAMKNCEALGITNLSNLILKFPGSDQHDVDETMRTLEFALPYRPLKPVEFWLGTGSPVNQNPHAYGIKAVYNHPHWSYLFPQNIFRSMSFMIQAYRGDRQYQHRLWRPVRQKIKAWEKSYRELNAGLTPEPILSYRDGRNFMIIRQRCHQADPITHRLSGSSRSIYLFCGRHRTLRQIVNRFSGLGEDRILPFLKMMVSKKLMYSDNGVYLSLAVPVSVKFHPD